MTDCGHFITCLPNTLLSFLIAVVATSLRCLNKSVTCPHIIAITARQVYGIAE